MDDGRCIHGWDEKPPLTFHWQYLLMRGFWHRIFWGVH
jgi:hypothetical protein